MMELDTTLWKSLKHNKNNHKILKFKNNHKILKFKNNHKILKFKI